MISTLTMRPFKGIPVNLPKAATGQQRAAESATVTADGEGRPFLDKQAIAIAELGKLLRHRVAQNPALQVITHTGHSIDRGAIVETMEIARDANRFKLAIAVTPSEGYK